MAEFSSLFKIHGEIDINTEDSAAMDLYARVKRGDVSQCSFGFDIIREEREEIADGVMFIVKEVKLWEVSIVTFPAYEATSATARSTGGESKALDAWKTRIKERLANA